MSHKMAKDKTLEKVAVPPPVFRISVSVCDPFLVIPALQQYVSLNRTHSMTHFFHCHYHSSTHFSY